MLLAIVLVVAAAPEVNLLSLEAGTVLSEAAPAYGGAWSAEALTDGSATTGWSSPSGTRGPFAFSFELEQRSAMTALEVDNSGAEEGGYPGISAAVVELWVEGQKIVALDVPRRGKARAALPKNTLGRNVRLVVPKNHGNGSYTELMEVTLLGAGLEPTPAPSRSITGLWALEDGVIRLSADGGSLSGCVLRGADAWRLRGTLAGHVAKVSIEGLDRTKGAATLVVSSDGTKLRGRYQLNGFGSWTATRRDGPTGDCDSLIAQAALARRLDGARENITLLGVGFANDDSLQLESNDELTALMALLQARPTARVQLLVLGRSIDPAGDELKRCERRAMAVMNALTRKGIAPERVELGHGLIKWPTVKPEPRVEARWRE